MNKILNSEIEFRKQIILFKDNISKLYVFEDAPDKTIYFYCFLLNGEMFAAKEKSKDNFLNYYKMYKQIGSTLKLKNYNNPNNKVLKYIKKI